MLNAFGCGEVRMVAFEPVRANYHMLVAHLNSIPEAHNAMATGCIQPIQMAVGNSSGQRKIFGRGRLASLTYKDVYRRDMDGAEENVAVTSLDDWLRDDPAGRVDFLKIDVEGAEWPVLEGAMESMSSRRVTLFVLEYGHFWSRHLWEAANLKAPRRSYEELTWPTLRGVVQYMRAQGYEAYFFGTPYLLPITGMWWHDIYEVCTDPHSIVYRGIFGWCWFDVLLVDMQHPLAEALHQHFVPWHLLKDSPAAPHYRWRQ
jgi:FkbM family methyltransferase